MTSPVETNSPVQITQSGFFLPDTQDLPHFDYLEDKADLGQQRDPIHDRMQKHPFYGKRIQLRSINGKTSQPVVIGVSKRKGTDNGWVGVPRLSPAQQQIMESHGFAIAIPGETYVTVPDGYDVDCGTEKGLYEWEWLQFAAQIITDTDNYNPEKPHEGADKELYVLIPADEQRKTADTFVTRKNASDWIYEQNPREWYDIARLIGSGMDSSKQLDVFNYLMDVAHKTPDRIIAIKDDPHRKVKLLTKRLLDRGILQETNGVFQYNSVIIGTSEEQVLFYIMDAKNKAVVDHMRNTLGVDAGLGGQPVNTQYASYGSIPNEAEVMRQASSASSTLGIKPPTRRVQPVTEQADVPATPTTTSVGAGATAGTTELSNDDLGDDYMPDEEGDEAGTGASEIPKIAIPTAPAAGRKPAGK